MHLRHAHAFETHVCARLGERGGWHRITWCRFDSSLFVLICSARVAQDHQADKTLPRTRVDRCVCQTHDSNMELAFVLVFGGKIGVFKVALALGLASVFVEATRSRWARSGDVDSTGRVPGKSARDTRSIYVTPYKT